MRLPELPTGGPNDFDFFMGSWTVTHHRLKERFAAAPEWEDFPGLTRVEKKLGGMVNVDENVFPTKGFAGMTFRLFNPAARRWSIWWISTDGAELTPPVHGGFTGDEGNFHGEAVEGGHPVLVHFRWQKLGLNTARWTQGFSRDGETYETNWVMDFTRTGF